MDDLNQAHPRKSCILSNVPNAATNCQFVCLCVVRGGVRWLGLVVLQKLFDMLRDFFLGDFFYLIILGPEL